MFQTYVISADRGHLIEAVFCWRLLVCYITYYSLSSYYDYFNPNIGLSVPCNNFLLAFLGFHLGCRYNTTLSVLQNSTILHSFTSMDVDTCTLDDVQSNVKGFSVFSVDVHCDSKRNLQNDKKPKLDEFDLHILANIERSVQHPPTGVFGRRDLLRAIEFKARHGKFGQNSVVQQCFIPTNRVRDFVGGMQCGKEGTQCLY